MKLLTDISIAPEGGFRGFGPLGNITEEGQGVSKLSSIISMAIGVMTIVAIIWFVFTFITGALSIIGSGGDKQALESAKKKITTGAVGLIVVILALVVINLIGKIIGIPNILNIGALFGLITNSQ